MPPPLLVEFAAGAAGAWRIDRADAMAGDGLPAAERLSVVKGFGTPARADAGWNLRGVTSNMRYTFRPEVDALAAPQQGLLRPEATRAAPIPIRETEAWWTLAQDERRAIFAEQWRPIGIGLDYLPTVARRLHQSRELGDGSFDFLPWFEYAPSDGPAFDELLRRRRATEEWRCIDREVDIRLVRG